MEKKTRILHVEDEADIRAVVKIALEKGRFVVRSCSSGEEALRAVSGFRPDLILLDVMMPVMDGPATLEAIRKIPGMAGVPVIFFTAVVQAHEREAYKKMGVQGVIAKPFDPIQLVKIVRDLLNNATPS